MNKLSDYQTQNLMLLLGTNPLPNYIAAKMLCGENTQLHLVTTQEIRDKDIHKRLLETLGKDANDQTYYVHLDSSSDPDEMFGKVKQRVTETPGSWGLHYTGGKKSMVLQAYRAMQNELSQKKQADDRVYSYLDADSDQLLIESPSRRFAPIPIDLDISLETLLKLHGQPDTVLKKIQPGKGLEPDAAINLGVKEPRRKPFQPEFCQIFLDSWLKHPEDMADWRLRHLQFSSERFLWEILEKEDGFKEHARRALQMLNECDPLEEISGKKVKKSNEDYRQNLLSQVEFPAFIAAAKPEYATLSNFAQSSRQEIRHFAKWLGGSWLEDYVLEQVLALQEECKLQDWALGLESAIFEPENLQQDVFESDVIVMRYHRLFYISVTTDDRKDLNKSKLFEAYLRAQQLGGEHAKAALVTFYKDPERLAKELHSQIHAKVKTFGTNDLQTPQTFQAALREWFTQN